MLSDTQTQNKELPGPGEGWGYKAVCFLEQEGSLRRLGTHGPGVATNSSLQVRPSQMASVWLGKLPPAGATQPSQQVGSIMLTQQA